MGGVPRLTGPQLPIGAMGTITLLLGDAGGGSQLNKCQNLQYFSFGTGAHAQHGAQSRFSGNVLL